MNPLSTQVFHILVALADSDRHGYGIMQDVAERTNGRLKLSAGTLYGAIQRMLEAGWVKELPGIESNERRRVYRLTPLGRKVVKAEAARMAELVDQARAYGLAPDRA